MVQMVTCSLGSDWPSAQGTFLLRVPPELAVQETRGGAARDHQQVLQTPEALDQQISRSGSRNMFSAALR